MSEKEKEVIMEKSLSWGIGNYINVEGSVCHGREETEGSIDYYSGIQ